jgi:microsomal epoxide hydrolase
MFSGPPLKANPLMRLKKPFGHSNFPKELLPMPKSWVATTGNMVWYKHHDKGGHFAALEVPEVLANDIVEFVKSTWKV